MKEEMQKRMQGNDFLDQLQTHYNRLAAGAAPAAYAPDIPNSGGIPLIEKAPVIGKASVTKRENRKEIIRKGVAGVQLCGYREDKIGTQDDTLLDDINTAGITIPALPKNADIERFEQELTQAIDFLVDQSLKGAAERDVTAIPPVIIASSYAVPYDSAQKTYVRKGKVVIEGVKPMSELIAQQQLAILKLNEEEVKKVTTHFAVYMLEFPTGKDIEPKPEIPEPGDVHKQYFQTMLLEKVWAWLYWMSSDKSALLRDRLRADIL